jgi:hypothetical protein
LIGFGDVLSLLRRAAEVAVRKNPSNFVDLVSTDMLGYLGQLVMRGHFYLNQLMTDEDGDLNRRRRWTPSRELDEFLPKLMSLQMHFAELAKAVASAKRLGELTRQRESAKRNMPRKRQRSPRRRRSTPKSRFTSGRGKKS